MPAYSKLARLARAIHSAEGVGFWRRADAEAFAVFENARTGLVQEVTHESTPEATHTTWFVKAVPGPIREEATA